MIFGILVSKTDIDWSDVTLKYPLYINGFNFTIFENNSDNILDGCYHVYLDVGTNVGVQVNTMY